MSDVQFEEEDILIDKASFSARDTRSGFAKLIMKMGAKTESQANYVLIGIMFICFLTMMYVIANYIV